MKSESLNSQHPSAISVAQISPQVSHISLNRTHFRHNVSVFQSLLKAPQTLCAVVKADAYGHDIRLILPELLSLGVNTFAVSRSDEALWIRQQAPEARILVLCEPLATCLDTVLEHRLEPCLNTLADLETFTQHKAAFYSQHLQVHFKLDSGMGRLGMTPQNILQVVQNGLFPAEDQKPYRFGLMTHFAQSELPDSPITQQQCSQFLDFVSSFRKYYTNIETHSDNSSAALNQLLLGQTDMVRVGIGLYGGLPDPQLKPVLAWHSQLCHIRHVPASSGIGYGQTYHTHRTTRLAVIPVGYRLGYEISNSNKSVVSVAGHFAPVIGRVSMDLTTIDVTDIPLSDEELLGQKATLISHVVDVQHELHVVKMAQRQHTISYEILCQIHPGITRNWEK